MALMSSLASYVTDKLREKGVSITLLRKVNNSIGESMESLSGYRRPIPVGPNCALSLPIAFFGTGLCLVGVVLSECNQTLSIIFFVVGLGLNGCCYPGFLANYVDMAPDLAGVLMGFANSFGNTPGFIAPYTASSLYSGGVSHYQMPMSLSIDPALDSSKASPTGPMSSILVLRFTFSLK